MKHNRILAYLYSVIFMFGIGALGYLVPRTSFYILFTVYSFVFLAYRNLYCLAITERTVSIFLMLAIMLRLVLLFSIPQWSDDYARFLWDGHLITEGYNPYTHTPAKALIEFEFQTQEMMNRLYSLMNSTEYHSVYPPSNQLVFWFASSLSNGHLLSGIMLIRLVLFAFEMLAFYFIALLLRILHQPRKKLLLYALNPLVIMEITGNLHFEGLMLTMILGAIYFLASNKNAYSGGSLAVAVAVKLSPLILYPAIIKTLSKRQLGKFALASTFVLLISLSPLIYNALPGFIKSLRLYGDTFEFNASVYYLLRELGYWIFGYNVIYFLGPMLKGLTLLLILVFSLKTKNKDIKTLLENLLLVYWVYFIFNTVVHPWYILPAIALSIFTEKKTFLVWSFLIFLSYHAYGNPNYAESLWLIALEYTGLCVFLIWESRKGWALKRH